MKWAILVATLITLAAESASCGGPTITVQNKTKFPVRVIVTSGGKSEVFSPSPGESSNGNATEGPYRVVAVPDEEWINYAKATRQYLNDQLANSDNLTGSQLLNVVQRLKDIAAKMAQYQSAGGGASCSGTVSSDRDALADVDTGTDGKLTVSCK